MDVKRTHLFGKHVSDVQHTKGATQKENTNKCHKWTHLFGKHVSDVQHTERKRLAAHAEQRIADCIRIARCSVEKRAKSDNGE